MKLQPFTFSQIAPYIAADIKAGNTPALLGEPGIGKSSYVKDLVEKDLHGKFFPVMVNEMADKTDLTGARTVKVGNDYEQRFFPHLTIRAAMDYANTHADELVVIFYDEFNRTELDVMSAIFTTLTSRSLGGRPFADNIRFMVAGNDKGGIQSLTDATTTRLNLMQVEPDLATLYAHTDFLPYIKNVLNQPTVKLLEKSVPIDYEDTDENSDDSDDFGIEGLTEDVYVLWTNPRTIESLDKRLRSFDITGDIDHDGDILRNLLRNREVFEYLTYGIVGKTSFATAFIDSLVDLLLTLENSQQATPSPVTHTSLLPNDRDDDVATQLLQYITDCTEYVGNKPVINRSKLEGVLTDALIDSNDPLTYEKVTCELAITYNKSNYPALDNQTSVELIALIDTFAAIIEKTPLTTIPNNNDVSRVIVEALNMTRLSPKFIERFTAPKANSFITVTINAFC